MKWNWYSRKKWTQRTPSRPVPEPTNEGPVVANPNKETLSIH